MQGPKKTLKPWKIRGTIFAMAFTKLSFGITAGIGIPIVRTILIKIMCTEMTKRKIIEGPNSSERSTRNANILMKWSITEAFWNCCNGNTKLDKMPNGGSGIRKIEKGGNEEIEKTGNAETEKIAKSENIKNEKKEKNERRRVLGEAAAIIAVNEITVIETVIIVLVVCPTARPVLGEKP